MIRREDITLVPMGRDQANEIVTRWHRHHKPVAGYKFATGAVLGADGVVACIIVSRPVSAELDDGFTFEVTRHTCRGGDKNVASMLLGAARDAAFAMGYRCGVSYTRADEDGTAYKAAGWVAVADVKARGWQRGNGATDRGRKQTILPGFYEPSTDPVDRIRWETRPSAHLRAVSKACAALWRFGAAWKGAGDASTVLDRSGGLVGPDDQPPVADDGLRRQGQHGPGVQAP